MEISEIFIGKPSDGFFRRYAFALFAFAYLTALTKIWPNPLDRPAFLDLAGGWIVLLGLISWYLAFKTRAAFKLLTAQYPGQDFSAYNASHLRLMGYAKKHSPESNVTGSSIGELKSFVKQLKKAKSSKSGILSQLADGFTTGRNATGGIGSSISSHGASNSVSPLSGNPDLSTPKASLWPKCTQGGVITKWDGKNLEYQILCTHCGDDQRPKFSDGGYVYNSPSPIRVTINSEHDLNITYGYKCNICGNNSETRISNGNVQ